MSAAPRLTQVPDDDAALVARAAAGDDRAFGLLYRRHARYVAGVVFRLLGDESELDDVVRQALHLLRVAGPEHVALGADFEGGIRPAQGLEDASHFPDLARALRRAGVSESGVRKVFAENALRVLCRSGK